MGGELQGGVRAHRRGFLHHRRSEEQEDGGGGVASSELVPEQRARKGRADDREQLILEEESVVSLQDQEELLRTNDELHGACRGGEAVILGWILEICYLFIYIIIIIV